ncbi:MAG: DUF1801 domain-containing protein [Chloroflexi bacterium AL-W]|nr:DUF1801 domain-containing protein [Chloroflexi bacterium AL-N1]NOK70829.1 DUF1801 domain-containing protein [Chloroflexi bacterium AL-N10]NOK78389.1 DUF1801 domain-containing protein [Chloroflexi bacterium AL-N5]NOK85370.1 DUF1801 domain-containing protein [Chloroflexi bacterium AL-W]NOK92646.1 DUF1801 domain-containing protein [Chloroflexi bacterium AL-N15]
MKKVESKAGMNASQRITNQIAELNDWRGKKLAQLHKLILEAAPEITEEWKWDTAVWTQNGLVCSVSAFKDHVKINFFKGASLKDPKNLFNAGLEAKATRAIDFDEDSDLNEPALKELVRAAVDYNTANNQKK